MPHSGGGGSHSGGHHSGGHHSHSGSGSGSSQPRMSNTYFPGSRRYVYYHNRQAHYYYAKTPYRTSERLAGSIALGFMGFIFTLLPILLALAFFKFSSGPLPLNYDTRIVIDDEVGVVMDKLRLQNELAAFQEKTGITVSVVTRTPETAFLGTDCETQAYNCYVKLWDDESHWLIYYVGSTKDRSDDWQWNLMCGNDCSRVLSSKQENNFTEEFHRRLVASNRYIFDQCIIEALETLKPQTGRHLIMRDGVKVNGEESGGQPASIMLILFLALFLVIGILLLTGAVVSGLKKPTEEELAKANAIEVPTDTEPRQAVCPYCSGVYFLGTVVSCPHCGAPVEVRN